VFDYLASKLTERKRLKEEQQKIKDERLKAKAERWQVHEALLDKAAGVSTVTLVCHPLTWREVYYWAYHRLLTGLDDEPLMKVPLAGPELIKVLGALYFRAQDKNVETRALAKRVYEGIAQVIDGVEKDATPATPIPDIVIDDELGPTSSSGAGSGG
jgi:hypothetical protein